MPSTCNTDCLECHHNNACATMPLSCSVPPQSSGFLCMDHAMRLTVRGGPDGSVGHPHQPVQGGCRTVVPESKCCIDITASHAWCVLSTLCAHMLQEAPGDSAGAVTTCNADLPSSTTYARFLYVIKFLAANGFYVLIDNHLSYDDTAVTNPSQAWQLPLLGPPLAVYPQQCHAGCCLTAIDKHEPCNRGSHAGALPMLALNAPPAACAQWVTWWSQLLTDVAECCLSWH